MKIRLDDSKVELAPNQMLTISGGLGMTVTCVRGTLWITQNNDLSDVVLGPGESFTVSRDGIALLSAMEASTVAMAAPASPYAAWLRSLVSVFGKVIGRVTAPFMLPARHPAVELRYY